MIFPYTGYTVTYDGAEPWCSGIPFVSLEVEEVFAAGQVGLIRTVTLNGSYPSGGVDVITGIQRAFSKNFKEFVAPNVKMPHAMIQEVSFGSQNYFGKVDYSITLKDFSGFLYGVNDPVDDITYSYDQDGSVSISRKISAVGIDTGVMALTAFQNAVSFVQGRTGITNLNLGGTASIPKENTGSIFLVSQQETINRTAGSYSITESYKYDPLRGTSDGTFKRFDVELNSGIGEDYYQVIVNGSYTVGNNVWNTGLLGRVASGELWGIAQTIAPNLNSTPLSFTVDAESVSQSIGHVNTGTRNLTVKATYDNSPTAAYFDYDVEATKDYKTDITQVSIKGVIVGDGRHVRRKFSSAYSFYTTNVGGWNGVPNYLYNLAMNGITDFAYQGLTFNSLPKSVNATINSGLGTITLNATFDNSPHVSGYSEFTWTVNTDCGLNVYKPYASANVNGFHLVQDLNILNRTNVTLNGSFGYPTTGVMNTNPSDSILLTLKNLEGTQNAFLESETYNKSSGESIKTGFNYVYSKDGRNLAALPANGKIYAGITI